MNDKQKTIYGMRAKIIKALAHPARLLIIDELAKQPLCVCDIREHIGTDLSTVSKHLSVLKNVGIVKDERRGVQIFYSLRCPCVSSFITCAEQVLEITTGEQVRALAQKRPQRK